MKKDRQCGNVPPYPVYSQYPGMNQFGYPMAQMPGTMVPAPGNMPMQGMAMQGMPMTTTGVSGGFSSNTIEQQMNNLEQQINLLENRVSNLENMYNNSNSINYSNNKYNSSNYQMM